MLELALRFVQAIRDGRARWADDAGAVSTEYGLVLFFIAVAIVAAVVAFGLASTGSTSKLPPPSPEADAHREPSLRARTQRPAEGDAGPRPRS